VIGEFGERPSPLRSSGQLYELTLIRSSLMRIYSDMYGSAKRSVHERDDALAAIAELT
jgi:hypothetical protein